MLFNSKTHSNGSTEHPINRRHFVQGSTAAAAVGCLLGPHMLGQASAAATTLGERRPIKKTLKIGMIGGGGSLTERFLRAKEAGFDGVELNSPGLNVDETLKAIDEAQFPVDGTVISTHWQIRHTSPDPAQREKALEDLIGALRNTHAVGGNTALLVVGHGQDGEESEIWPRAIENISKALPVAAELGVYIAIENVWNHFLYDHDGDSNQTADKFVKFVDELNSPWVGLQFDIGNHWKYGSMGDWIRTLGERIVKLDMKGFSRQENRFTKIGEGDLDWNDVRKALDEIGFTGWAAAEVGGGDLERLKEVAANMDQVLELES